MRRSTSLFDATNRPTPDFAAFLRDVKVPGDHLVSIDEALQRRFFQKDQVTGEPVERWELATVQVDCDEGQIRQHLATCGFLNATEPTGKSYARVAWPGALAPRAAARLLDIAQAWDRKARWQEVIVFGGKRPLQPDKEGRSQCCSALNVDTNSHKALWEAVNPVTELQMMRFLWVVACHAGILAPEFDKVPIMFVDAPMKPPTTAGGPPVRPNTEDTIDAWLQTRPEPGSLLLSSGAPYGMAQDEAFWMLLEPHGHTVETFGHAAPDLPIEAMMREVAGCVNRIAKARIVNAA